MPELHLRAGDADRAAVATALGRHMADGRLTVAEYDERVARAYAALTYGDLAVLTSDLPAADGLRAAPAVVGGQPAPVHPRRRPVAVPRPGSAGAWASWRRTAIIVLCIWAITSVASAQFIYFWPIWVIGPWGAVLLAQALTGDRRAHPARDSWND
jgi:hypothetical protein